MDNNELKRLALNVRKRLLPLSTKGGCFLGASLSAVDIVVYLYKNFLNIPRPDFEDRDLFFLSKGHDVPALYSLFVELGWMTPEKLAQHLKGTDHVYWHPNRNIPGIEFHSGSLGHLLSVGLGAAMDFKLQKKRNRVVVLLGDGELNEGTNWESLLVASSYKLDNLILVVDRNEFQANVRTEDLLPLEPLEDKFRAFGAAAITCDGHSFESLGSAFSKIPFCENKPTAVIAKTIRGKGIPSIEARADRWFCNFSEEEVQSLSSELMGGDLTHLKSETLTVR